MRKTISNDSHQNLDGVIDIFLISEFGYLLREIPLAFVGEKINIVPIGGPFSTFRDYANFVEIKKVTTETFVESFLSNESLIKTVKGLVLIGTDSELREISQADIAVNLKIKLLTIKNPQAFKIHDVYWN